MNHDSMKQARFRFYYEYKDISQKKTFFRGEENLPCAANFGAPGPDATYVADGLETANCRHWGHLPAAHCLGPTTNITPFV